MSDAVVLAPAKSSKRSVSEVFPVIVDESTRLIDLGTSGDEYRDEGLWANPDLSQAILSMSGYGKPDFASENHVYDSVEQLQDSMYLVTHSGSTPAHLSTVSIPYPRQTEQASYAAGALFQPRIYEDPYAGSFAVRSRQIPEVTQWQPKQGPQGTTISITLCSVFVLDPSWMFTAIFASRRCQCHLTSLESQGSYNQWLLSVQVPLYHETGWSCPSTRVPFKVHVQNGVGQSVGYVDVGTYWYTDLAPHDLPVPPAETSRKRKPSMQPSDLSRANLKRALAGEGASEEVEMPHGSAYGFALPGTSHLAQQSTVQLVDTSLTNLLPAYQAPQTQAGFQPSVSPGPMLRHLSAKSHGSLPSTRAQSPQTPGWSVPGFQHLQPTQNPGLTVPRPVGLSAPADILNPALIRTSVLPQSGGPGVGGSAALGSFNPYAIYPHKAVLRIHGNLDAMAEGWNKEEMENKRRLVQFWRTQEGSTIEAEFDSIVLEEREVNSICISCIWWEERSECFVTSVDAIYLLEALVGVRFTVEEKNRIRRNLEGFRPMTVSKGKPDSEEFFKLVMGFPNPKPRNIEKDVKVFPWKILGHALKKIIGKYSASYSSTASALPPSSGYRGGQPPRSDNDLDIPVVPSRMVPSSAVQMFYPEPLNEQVNAPSPTMPSVPHYPQPSSSTPYASYPDYQNPLQLGVHTGELDMLPSHRPSVDFATFVGASASLAASRAPYQTSQGSYGYPLAPSKSEA